MLPPIKQCCLIARKTNPESYDSDFLINGISNRLSVLWLFFFSLLTAAGFAQQSPDCPLPEGRWYVQLSNFPMWLKGNKTQPAFNYTSIKKGNKTVIKDDVNYIKNGKEKTISGYDYIDGDNKFTWRGKGLLRIAKSKWEIIYCNEKFAYAIIRFKKTIFTPAGIDVISRNRKLTEEIISSINEQLEVMGISEHLTRVSQ